MLGVWKNYVELSNFIQTNSWKLKPGTAQIHIYALVFALHSYRSIEVNLFFKKKLNKIDIGICIGGYTEPNFQFNVPEYLTNDKLLKLIL